MRARVLVKPKAGILDPQGQAVQRALPALGFTGVTDVSVGRMIELEVAEPERLPEMCERLLTNPLIEDYEIVAADPPETEILAADPPAPDGGAAPRTARA